LGRLRLQIKVRVVTIDCEYLQPRFAAAYLLIDPSADGSPASSRAAFIDNNTSHSVPLLLAALRDQGLTPEQVDFVIITHVHLDHAGGTSALMSACPNARLLAHPKAARHMIDPSKLVASARAVYGAEAFERMYGTIDPIAADRVQTVADEEEVQFGNSKLKFLHTRGHANHHACIVEPETQSVFTGDSFGLCYPALQRSGLFIFPSTSPTDFDYEQAVQSIDRITAAGTRAYLTHFGPVTDLATAALQLKEHLRESQEVLQLASDPSRAALDSDALTAYCARELGTRFEAAAARLGLQLNEADRELLRLDLELNAQGIAYAATSPRRHA
jgi:glyoxylase-like metal-dependent hydrolase (beta-lactamase superfamily II)